MTGTRVGARGHRSDRSAQVTARRSAGPESGRTMTSADRAQRLDFSEPHVLRNEPEYDAAVAEVDALLERDPAAGSPEYERLRFLAVLIGAYDDEHYPMGDAGTPQSAVAFMLEQKGMTRADLAPILGGRSRVSEFFSGKRRRGACFLR